MTTKTLKITASTADLNIYTREEAAAFMNVHARTIDRWADEGKLTRYRVAGHGRRVYFDTDELEKLSAPVPERTTLADCGCPREVIDYEGHQDGCDQPYADADGGLPMGNVYSRGGGGED